MQSDVIAAKVRGCTLAPVRLQRLLNWQLDHFLSNSSLVNRRYLRSINGKYALHSLNSCLASIPDDAQASESVDAAYE
jgi:hypothetical protein